MLGKNRVRALSNAVHNTRPRINSTSSAVRARQTIILENAAQGHIQKNRAMSDVPRPSVKIYEVDEIEETLESVKRQFRQSLHAPTVALEADIKNLEAPNELKDWNKPKAESLKPEDTQLDYVQKKKISPLAAQSFSGYRRNMSMIEERSTRKSDWSMADFDGDSDEDLNADFKPGPKTPRLTRVSDSSSNDHSRKQSLKAASSIDSDSSDEEEITWKGELAKAFIPWDPEEFEGCQDIFFSILLAPIFFLLKISCPLVSKNHAGLNSNPYAQLFEDPYKFFLCGLLKYRSFKNCKLSLIKDTWNYPLTIMQALVAPFIFYIFLEQYEGNSYMDGNLPRYVIPLIIGEFLALRKSYPPSGSIPDATFELQILKLFSCGDLWNTS